MSNRDYLLTKNAGFIKRTCSFFIDSFFSMFIFLICASFSFLNEKNVVKVKESIDDFKELFGNISFINLKDYQLRYFVNSPIFQNVIYTFLLSFIISVLYTFLSIKFLNSATIGQKIFSLKTLNLRSNEKPSIFRILIKSILVSIPIKFLYILVYLYIFHFNYYVKTDSLIINFFVYLGYITDIKFLIFISLFFLIVWFDIYFITNKLILSDILSLTRVVDIKNSDINLETNQKDFADIGDKVLDGLDNINKKLSNKIKEWLDFLNKKVSKK